MLTWRDFLGEAVSTRGGDALDVHWCMRNDTLRPGYSRRAFLGTALAALALGCERGEPRRLRPEASAEETPGESSTKEKDSMSDKSDAHEVAILAGGCFWGMEDLLRRVDGVLETEVGYAGGTTDSPTYQTVKTGRTGHAESVRIAFDPKRLSYAELLEKWFFRMHDPTTKNRQGNDIGTQYRSAIFFTSPEQEKTAHAVIEKVNASGVWKAPIVTEVIPSGQFTPAEDYHQDYLEKNPGGYTCHFLRDF